MFKCSKVSLNGILAKIAENATLYVPADNKDGKAVYTKWEDGVELSNQLNTVKSPKDFFFPQVEDMMAFKVEGKSIELTDIRIAQEDFVVYGVRACDAKAFEVLDNVFLVDPVDSYYAERRAHGVIITVACGKPSETCFCQTFGIDAANPGGDISVWKSENEVFWQSNTEKGAALLAKLGLEECGDDAVNAEKEKINAVMAKLPLAALKSDAFGGGKTLELFNRPEWQTLSESCLGCGTCTFVCPTCQCYDVKDFNTGNGIVRFRCWDSCMYSDFTKCAHGNPRLSQVERFRQRFMHKLVYYPENNGGLFGCVGCGRCLAKCPISMNIVKVMKTLGGNA